MQVRYREHPARHDRDGIDRDGIDSDGTTATASTREEPQWTFD
jgi:hypothetical protein